MSTTPQPTLPPGVFDPNDVDSSVFVDSAGNPIETAALAKPTKASRPQLLKFHSPQQLKDYQEPPNHKLVGDYHLQRGGITVLAGPPGCGKSRAAFELAFKGAEGTGSWLGLPIRHKFRTLILQNENGLARLHRDVPNDRDLKSLNDWVRISEPPSVGLALGEPFFREELRSAIRDFQPGLVIIDPFNATTRDAMEKDFSHSLALIRELLAESDENPAGLILHHLRKPKSDDRHTGRSLSHLLAGSYVLVSVARAVLVMQPASDDTQDNRVIITPTKNNDGELGARIAMERREHSFEPISDFDWNAHDAVAPKRSAKVTAEHLKELFASGEPINKPEAVARLAEISGAGRSAAYSALKQDGRLGHLLKTDRNGLISLRSSETFEDEES